MAPRSCSFPRSPSSHSVIDDSGSSFDKDNTQQDKKLDEMDLDDILNRAEDHETITGGDGGASLGGEGFLASVAPVSDVKTEISWEEIIPLEERQRVEREDDQRKAEELAALDTKDRKRSHAPVSYEGMDVDQPPSASTSKKPKGPAPTRKSASQKAMELKERDVRVLIRSMQKWGDIRQRYDIIVCSISLRPCVQLNRALQVADAKLQDKNKGMIIDVADDIVELCASAVEDNNTQKQTRMAAGETLTTAQKSKAVLVTYRNVGNINAETVLSRTRDLHILFNILSTLSTEELYSWSIPVDNIRPTLNWSGRWGPQEDSMLLVGAFRYGFGNWEVIAKDAKLGLTDKFFLEEGKKGEDSSTKPIPNAIHLVRRGDYLLGLLRDHEEKLRLYETSLRTKGQLRSSASPPPAATSSHSSNKRRAESEAVASVEDTSARKRKRRPTPTFTDSESSDEW
jgi:chromodomain-helicase-DNA-binding protein 1